jgi:hypothetical protein
VPQVSLSTTHHQPVVLYTDEDCPDALMIYGYCVFKCDSIRREVFLGSESFFGGIHAASLARRRVANATTILVTCYNTYKSYIFRRSP